MRTLPFSKRPAQQRPTRKLLGAIVAAALFLPDIGYTLGLGEIEVNSALNQKLNADIELLSAAPEDAETIIIKLASRKEFLRAGLDRPYLLNDLRFKAIEINGVPYIKVSSGSPIREPFLNFLVEIDWPNGHLLREYTVLLDPPVFMSQHTGAANSSVSTTSNNSNFRPGSNGSSNIVPVAAPGVSMSPSPSASAQAPAAQAQSGNVNQASANQTNWVPAPVVQQNTRSQPAGSYKIKAGDTAWSLADAMRPDQSITVPQMMAAILRANPESFINENINGLKRGYILRVPDYDQIASISQTDALAFVREQAALWRQYQQSQAGGQPVSAMEAGDTSSNMETGSAVAGGNDAYLEIVSAGSGSSTMSGKDPTDMTAQELRAELALAREKVETELVEKEALQQRVDTLQGSVEKMKGMLSIEDAELAGVQSLNLPDETSQTEEMMTDGVSTDDAAIEDTDVDAMTEDSAMADSEEMASAEMGADDAGIIEEEGMVDGDETADTVFVDEAATDDEAMAEQVAPVTNDVVATQPAVVNPEPEDSLAQILSNPMMLAAAGGGMVLIVVFIGLIIKRRKAATESAAPVAVNGFDDLESLADDIASEADDEATRSVTNEESVDDFDSTATMILDSAEDTVIAEPDASTEMDADEPRDDVIAEADVYLAYGIYQQAEELLTQAIADNPDRDDYRVKLAETHYASKNADAFVDVASDIKQRIDDDTSPTWKKIVGMGQDLCADNPMFQGSMVGGIDAGSMSLDSPAMDFDLGMDDEAASEIPDLDLSLDDEPLELPELDVGTATAESVDELEFDLGDAGAVEEPTDTEGDAFSLDIDASELDIDVEDEVESKAEDIDLSDDVEDSLDLTNIDIGLDDAVEVNSTDADVVEDIADGDIDFGLDDIDSYSEVEAETETKVEADEDISIDLTEEIESLDLNLADELTEEVAEEINTVSEVIEAAPVASNDFGDDEGDFDLSSLDDVDEISTKLDLARAYLDMGDHEGTKGILDEVLADGDDEQKREANELMEKLG